MDADSDGRHGGQRGHTDCREGLINQSTVPTGYTMGTTVLIVDGLPAVAAPIFAAGEKLYFKNNLRTDYYEYTIASWYAVGPPVTGITLEEPGLVFDVKDNWKFTVLRPAKVNNPRQDTRAAGTTSIAIDGYTGAVADGEKFVIKSENITHTITSHAGSSAHVRINFTPGLQADYVAADASRANHVRAGQRSTLFQ